MADEHHDSGVDEVDYEGEDAPVDKSEAAVEAAADTNNTEMADAPAEEAKPAPEGVTPADGAKSAAEATEDEVKPAMEASNLTPDPEDPNDPLHDPPFGSECFVGGIPKELTDDQLKEFASPAGEVHSVSITKDPSTGAGKGFGFVKFKTKAAADNAKATLHSKPLKDFPDSKVRVLPSQGKNRLYIGNLPKVMTHAEVESTLKSLTKGLLSLELVKSKENPVQNRGFCFTEFYNTACANHAKNALGPPYTMQGRSLTITFAEPRVPREQAESGVSAGAAGLIKSVFVGQLPESVNEEKLKEVFSSYGSIEKVVIPAAREDRPRREFGFVHFEERESAVRVVESPDKFILDGKELNVKYGRPQVPQGQEAMGGRGFGGAARGGFAGRGRGRGGSYGAPAHNGGGYKQAQYGGEGYGYEQNYGGGGAGAVGGDFGVYGGYAGAGGFAGGGGYPAAAVGAMGAMGGGGMSMVPMMLPNGQIGYVLSSAAAVTPAVAGGGAAMGGYGNGGGGGPVRTGRGGGGGGRGRGDYGRGRGQRWQPY